MATGGQQYDTQRLSGRVKTLLGRELKLILKDLDLPVSGSKAAMQDRLLTKIRDTANASDTLGYNRVKKLISPDIPTFVQQPNLPNPRENPPSYNSSHPPLPPGSGAYGAYPGQRAPMPNQPAGQFAAGLLRFKDSPFYEVLEPLSQVLECKIRQDTRDTLVVRLPLDERVIQRLQADSNIRVMLFSAADNGGLNPYFENDIAFPHQVDLRVNLDDVKANLRGLKNKAGTTRPADITSWLRKIPKYSNEIRLTTQGSAPLKQKKYYVIVNLVRKVDTQDLVQKFKDGRLGKRISRDQVVKEMRNKAQDPDITTTSTVMSLKCPLSTLRMQVPCRSLSCNHNQCFDASSFLQLQEQAPTWSCPICNKAVTFKQLMVDEYVEDIIARTEQSVEQVTIEPDGSWSENVAVDTSFASNGTNAASPDDDDDLVEIQDMRVHALKQEAGPRFSPLHRTPPASSREQSTASSRPSSNKRPASAVIDLTLSDEEEAAAPAPKRPSYTSSTSGGLPLRNGERESMSASSPNTVSGGITFGIPNNIGRSLYPNQYH